jgi:hypothetical protein
MRDPGLLKSLIDAERGSKSGRRQQAGVLHEIPRKTKEVLVATTISFKLRRTPAVDYFCRTSAVK